MNITDGTSKAEIEAYLDRAVEYAMQQAESVLLTNGEPTDEELQSFLAAHAYDLAIWRAAALAELTTRFAIPTPTRQ